VSRSGGPHKSTAKRKEKEKFINCEANPHRASKGGFNTLGGKKKEKGPELGIPFIEIKKGEAEGLSVPVLSKKKGGIDLRSLERGRGARLDWRAFLDFPNTETLSKKKKRRGGKVLA